MLRAADLAFEDDFSDEEIAFEDGLIPYILADRKKRS
jgi:hypothetical protein